MYLHSEHFRAMIFANENLDNQTEITRLRSFLSGESREGRFYARKLIIC